MEYGLKIVSGVYPITDQGKLKYAYHAVRDGWLVRYIFDSYEQAQFELQLTQLLLKVGITTK